MNTITNGYITGVLTLLMGVITTFISGGGHIGMKHMRYSS